MSTVIETTLSKSVPATSIGAAAYIYKPSQIPDPSQMKLWPLGIDPNVSNAAAAILGVMAYLPGGGGGPGAGWAGTNQSAIAAPGFCACLRGSNFGATQGSGYVRLTDNGNSWGGPKDSASIQVICWRSDFIEFAVPSGSIDVSLLPANSVASVVVVNSVGLASGPVHLNIVQTPQITSVSPTKASAGSVVTIVGQHFGAIEQPVVLLNNNGFAWRSSMAGCFVPKHLLQLLNWSDSQIQFLVPTDKAAHPGDAVIEPGSTATIEVVNGAGVSNNATIALTTSVRWPVSVISYVANIGGTGDGHMQTSVTIDEAGDIYGSTHTWDTDNPLGFFGFLTGFHGGAIVILVDVNGDPINPAYTAGPYGVEGGQSRNDSWSAKINQDQRDRVYSVSIVHQYEPQWNTPQEVLDWVAGHKDQITAATQVVAAVAAVV